MFSKIWKRLADYFYAPDHNVALHLRSDDFEKPLQYSLWSNLMFSHQRVLDEKIVSLEDICPNILETTEKYGSIDTLIVTIHGNVNGQLTFINSDHHYDLRDQGKILDCLKDLPKNIRIILQICHGAKSDPDKISVADLITAYAPPSAEIYGSEYVLYYPTLQIQFDTDPIEITIQAHAENYQDYHELLNGVKTNIPLKPYQTHFKNKCKTSLEFFGLFEDACRQYGLSDYTSDQDIAACYLDDTCFEDRLTRLPSIYKQSKNLKISNTASEFPKYLKNPTPLLSADQIQSLCQKHDFFYQVFNALCSEKNDLVTDPYDSIRTEMILIDFKQAFDWPLSDLEKTDSLVFEQFKKQFVFEQYMIDLQDQIQNDRLTFVEKCEQYIAFSVLFERDCRKMGISEYNSDLAIRACYGNMACLSDRFRTLPPIYALSKQLDLNEGISDFSKLVTPEEILNTEESKELCEKNVEFFGLFPELCSTVSEQIVDLTHHDNFNNFLLPWFSDFKKSFQKPVGPDLIEYPNILNLPTTELMPVQEDASILSDSAVLGTFLCAVLAKNLRNR